MRRFSIRISPAGTIRVIYHDALRPLLIAGDADIRRASHVEPTSDGQWTADLTPMRGPILGPYLTRAEALTAETDWLTQHWLRCPPGCNNDNAKEKETLATRVVCLPAHASRGTV